MRLFLVVASFLTFALFTAARGEDRIAIAQSPVHADTRGGVEIVGDAQRKVEVNGTDRLAGGAVVDAPRVVANAGVDRRQQPAVRNSQNRNAAGARVTTPHVGMDGLQVDHAACCETATGSMEQAVPAIVAVASEQMALDDAPQGAPADGSDAGYSPLPAAEPGQGLGGNDAAVQMASWDAQQAEQTPTQAEQRPEGEALPNHAESDPAMEQAPSILAAPAPSAERPPEIMASAGEIVAEAPPASSAAFADVQEMSSVKPPGSSSPAPDPGAASEEPVQAAFIAPPSAPGPIAPAETTIARHPMLDAPDSVVVAEVFTVSVALTEWQMTPEATARAGPTTSLNREGALEFSMPAEAEEWPIDIDLLAAGFDLADGGKWSRRVKLYKQGDSDFARFEIKARPIQDASKPRQLMARFYHAGRFLGSALRPVTVLREKPLPETSGMPADDQVSVASAPQEMVLTSNVRIGDQTEVPDLDVTIHYDDPDNLGHGLIVVHSPYIRGPVSAEFTTPAGMTEWLNSEYLQLVRLGLKVRGATSLSEPVAKDPASQKRFIAMFAEGFGDELYRRYVPQPFKDVFWSLKHRGLLNSIQITSNSPVLPWELVRPHAAEGALSDGFLGINYRLARWAPRTETDQIDQPLDRMPFTGVATVAPPYDNNLELPFQQTEIEALSKLDGFELIGGDFSAFEKMVREVSTGFIHFSGHGEINDPGTGAPVFAIRLTDQLLDPTTWGGMTFASHDRGNPFYFFNACDTGQAASLGGFVQGWGPAILAKGASGFIGGMWPLTDRTAASFSAEFYGGVTADLDNGPVYLAEVLQGVRKRFYETGDPTYLAYTFYGNANLQVVDQ